MVLFLKRGEFSKEEFRKLDYYARFIDEPNTEHIRKRLEEDEIERNRREERRS